MCPFGLCAPSGQSAVVTNNSAHAQGWPCEHLCHNSKLEPRSTHINFTSCVRLSTMHECVKIGSGSKNPHALAPATLSALHHRIRKISTSGDNTVSRQGRKHGSSSRLYVTSTSERAPQARFHPVLLAQDGSARTQRPIATLSPDVQCNLLPGLHDLQLQPSRDAPACMPDPIIINRS